jgi:hypothetical protein
MSFLDFLPTVAKIIDKIIPDPAAKAAAQLELAKMQQSGELAQLAADTKLVEGQLEINKIEAASSNLFVSGWRPFIGWVCGLALTYQFLIRPIVGAILQTTTHPVVFPTLEMGTLMTLLGTMLGFGAMRTTEKLQGVAK